MPVNCGKCNTQLAAHAAFRCSCGKMFFCSEEHFQADPHSSIEDDEHEEANEYIESSVDVKLSRLVGKGGYGKLMARLTNAMMEGSKLSSERSKLPLEFGKETTSTHRSQVEAQIGNILDAWKANDMQGFTTALSNLETIWKSDSPRTKNQIEVAVSDFIRAAGEYKENPGTISNKSNLTSAGLSLARALNGKTQ